MKFGLFYLFSDFGDIPQDQVFNEVLDEIEYAEELGFDSIWLPEHHFAVYGMLGNPLTFAAAIAQRTKRMKIGTAVMVLPFQHPLRVAEDAALVDAMSGGRLLLGVGRGYQPPEFHGFGVPQSDSSAMFNESIEIIKRALSGEKFTFEGQFWNIEEPTEIFPKPIQKPHPPFYLASVTPRSLDIAARHGMSLLRAPQFSTLDAVAEAYTTYQSMMRERARPRQHRPAIVGQNVCGALHGGGKSRGRARRMVLQIDGHASAWGARPARAAFRLRKLPPRPVGAVLDHGRRCPRARNRFRHAGPGHRNDEDVHAPTRCNQLHDPDANRRPRALQGAPVHGVVRQRGDACSARGRGQDGGAEVAVRRKRSRVSSPRRLAHNTISRTRVVQRGLASRSLR